MKAPMGTRVYVGKEESSSSLELGLVSFGLAFIKANGFMPNNHDMSEYVRQGNYDYERSYLECVYRQVKGKLRRYLQVYENYHTLFGN